MSTMSDLIAYDMALDCDEPCNNDKDPTEPHWDDYRDWWSGQPPAWAEYADMIVDDPLLGVVLGAPHEVVMPDGCSRAGAGGTP